MLKFKNRIEEKEVKGAEKASFGGPNLLYLTLRKVTKLYKYITDKKSFPILVTSLFALFNPNSVLAADKYGNFEELKANESPLSYNILTTDIDRRVVILAPHGGGIEGGTSELARELSKSYSTYLFEGLRIPGASELHITSTNFDEPRALDLLNKHDLTISIHGYASSEKHTLVGGTDRVKAAKITSLLIGAGFSAELLPEGSRLAGTNEQNIANKNSTGMSIQLEISTEQRREMFNTFTLAGRNGTQNQVFYDYIAVLTKFINENVYCMAGVAP
ncbi:poly-gamma-glutamate hydrolase family protein [Bacillus spizizenii]|nr:poly-gamma-glutamate hydrolase family protein [Bacillus spizizenii]MCY7989953.1 poly-gamma-glutamate hydrolase family protein [Bacillus spizizenii]MCY7996741.1 poly-gamma-glutamate hydrolase family protein [Bacillus spizizenii]MCY8051298.1 poly-gamma-glutamate hydrolase family protein [Bacillus spizizenii]MCY8300260.1 poly-gamma-glutamate hydrolase family protein [Bacillus spizizenii]